MRAVDLAERIPTVTVDTTGTEAARMVAEYRLNALVVVDADGLPVGVIPGSQILGLIVPGYVRDDPALAHAIDERAADELCHRLGAATIGGLVDARRGRPFAVPTVAPEDTLVELASVMVEAGVPLVLVRDEDGTFHGAVTMSRLLAAVAVLAGEQSALLERRLTRDIADRGRPWPETDPTGPSEPQPGPAGQP